jgi:hypothetical protein
MEKLRLFQLFVTIVIASQGIFYLLGLAGAMSNVSVATFAETRKAIDDAIANRLRILYYAALLSGILVLICSRNDLSGKVFICTMIATLLIIIDIGLALKGSIPINIEFKQYPNSKVNWSGLQAEWIKLIYYRGVLSTVALIMLLHSWSK